MPPLGSAVTVAATEEDAIVPLLLLLAVLEATVTKLDETTLLECVDVMDTLPLGAELEEEL